MNRNLANQIAARLRRDILRGRLPPGSSVKERDNAAEMGVSRTPMREAIRMLADEGLVVLRPARSPIVANPSIREIEDQVEVLLALERLSAEKACQNAKPEDIRKLEAIMAVMERDFDKTDPLDMFEIDMSFHSALVRASHNEVLARTHRTFLERLWRARYLAAVQRRNRDRVVNQHGKILGALKDRDLKAIRDAIDLHLGNLAEDIRKAVEAEEATRTLESDLAKEKQARGAGQPSPPPRLIQPK